jgi:hypothetical protein
MNLLTTLVRCARKPASFAALLAGAWALTAVPGFCAGPGPETIQATVTQGSHAVSITLVIDGFSSPADLATLSAAFQQGQDRGLVAALSKIKAVGHCSIAGALGYDVAFIQVVATSTGRQITFIANRPLQPGEDNSNAPGESFDLAVGQFDLNDADMTKSSGFLYPASKLAIDPQGEFHYDLAGAPWGLVYVLDSRQPPREALALTSSK